MGEYLFGKCLTWILVRHEKDYYFKVFVCFMALYFKYKVTMSVKTEKTGGEYSGVADWVLFMYGLGSDPLLREI